MSEWRKILSQHVCFDSDTTECLFKMLYVLLIIHYSFHLLNIAFVCQISVDRDVARFDQKGIRHPVTLKQI